MSWSMPDITLRIEDKGLSQEDTSGLTQEE